MWTLKCTPYSRTALPWGSRSWVVETQSNLSCVTPTLPHLLSGMPWCLTLSWNEAPPWNTDCWRPSLALLPACFLWQFNGRKSSFIRQTGDHCEMSRWQSVWYAVVFLGWANRWMMPSSKPVWAPGASSLAAHPCQQWLYLRQASCCGKVTPSSGGWEG